MKCVRSACCVLRARTLSLVSGRSRPSGPRKKVSKITIRLGRTETATPGDDARVVVIGRTA